MVACTKLQRLKGRVNPASHQGSCIEIGNTLLFSNVLLQCISHAMRCNSQTVTVDKIWTAFCRLTSAIDDEAVMKIAKRFDAHGLFEHAARARRQATGSMFPTHVG